MPRKKNQANIVGRRPKLDGCMAIAAVALIRKKRGGVRVWTPDSLAGLRWRSGRARSGLRNRLSQQLATRGLDGAASSTEIADAFRHSEHLIRGQLGLRLEAATLKLCSARSNGPERVDSFEVAAYDTLPLDDLQALVEELEAGRATSVDAKTLSQLAGPGLAAAWRENFGSRLNAPRRRVLPAQTVNRSGSRDWRPARSSVAIAPAAAPSRRLSPPVVETDQPAKPKKRSWRKAFLAALACSFFFSATAYHYVDPGWRAYRILMKFGGTEAVSFMKQHLNTGDRAYYYFGFAKYQAGDFETASAVTHELLKRESANKTLIGDCHYLLGLIKAARGSYQAAYGSMFEAEEYYTERHLVRRHLIALEKANAAAAFNLGDALRHWETARDLACEYADLSYLFSARVRIALAQDDYEDALDWAMKSFEHAKNKVSLFKAHSDLGFVYAALGDVDNAFFHTDQADLQIEPGDTRKSMFNLVNKIAIYNVRCLDDSALERELQSWLDEHPNEILRQHLAKAKSFGSGAMF